MLQLIKTKVKLTRHIISQRGFRSNPKKTEEVKKMPILENPMEIRRFIRKVKNTSHFAKNLFKIVTNYAVITKEK